MPAWTGGPCPDCGDDMPANLVHCQTCRRLLNDDLSQDSVHIPVFQPLQEIEAVIDAQPEGYYVECPHCAKELKFHRKYLGLTVACKFCAQPLTPQVQDTFAFFVACPHCEETLRNNPRYLGKKAACKHCDGHIRFVEPTLAEN